MQLKEIYSESVQEKRAVAEENRKLKELLRMNGIQYNSREQSITTGFPTDLTAASSSSRSASAYGYGGQSQQQLSPSHAHGSMGNSPSFGSTEFFGDQTAISSRSNLNPQSAVPSLLSPQSGLQGSGQQHQQPPSVGAQQSQASMLNYDQLGVDFVLASVPHDDSQDLGHTPPPPAHHLPSQDFPPYDPRSR